MKTQERNKTPGKLNRAKAAAKSSASMYGAPANQKGFVVPLPSDICVPSRWTVAGKTAVVSGVGIFGEGRTHGPSVSPYQSSRVQPDMVTYSASHPMAKCSLNIL